jgi:hypothetical protein
MMVKCSVFFEARTECLNAETRFRFRGLQQHKDMPVSCLSATCSVSIVRTAYFKYDNFQNKIVPCQNKGFSPVIQDDDL